VTARDEQHFADHDSLSSGQKTQTNAVRLLGAVDVVGVVFHTQVVPVPVGELVGSLHKGEQRQGRQGGDYGESSGGRHAPSYDTDASSTCTSTQSPYPAGHDGAVCAARYSSAFAGHRESA